MPSKGLIRSIYSMRKDILESTMGVQVRGWEKSSSLSFLFRCSHSFVTRFFLGLVLYSILFLYFYCCCCWCFIFFAKKTMFSFQTLLKGTFSLLTCHLQFSITARVSMTLKRQSLSDHKTTRTFCVSQERGIVERMVWSKQIVVPSCLEQRWGEGRVGETGERSEK